jgi:hypothetical protein
MKTLIANTAVLKIQALFWAILAAILLATSACNPLEVVKGRGDVISENRSVGPFAAIDSRSDVDIYLSQGPAEPVRIEGQDNILNVIETYVRNNELVIRTKPGVILRRHDQVRVYITNPELKAVRISGSGYVEGRTNWQVNDFKVNISGSGKLDMTLLDADYLDSDISGSGNLYLTGSARSHDISISGSGDVHAFDLTSQDVNAHISGSGSCELQVSKKLDAKISGSGKIRYKGNPTINSKITGSGRVEHAD